jgi:hypothetical protein
MSRMIINAPAHNTTSAIQRERVAAGDVSSLRLEGLGLVISVIRFLRDGLFW